MIAILYKPITCLVAFEHEARLSLQLFWGDRRTGVVMTAIPSESGLSDMELPERGDNDLAPLSRA